MRYPVRLVRTLFALIFMSDVHVAMAADHAMGTAIAQQLGQEHVEQQMRSAPVQDKPDTSDGGNAAPSALERDWRGLGRDTAFFLGYQAVFAGVLYLLPESVTKWTAEQRKTSMRRWWENVQHPQWDSDLWYVNYLGHPYFGAIAYIRARERRFGALGGFWYAGLLSGLYEIGIEALFERPSYQDLVVTPVAGLLLGAFLFEPIREHIQGKPELQWYDHLTLTVTDPLGAANSLVERWLGIEVDVQVQLRALPLRRMRDLTSLPPGFSTGRRNSTAGPPGLASNSSLKGGSGLLDAPGKHDLGLYGN